MASNELTGFLAAVEAGGHGSGSILDRPLREVLLRAVTPADLPRYWTNVLHPGASRSLEPLLTSILETARTDKYDIDLFHVLERERSDVASVARFGHRVECASYYLYVAFEKARVEDFELSGERNVVKPKRGISLWYCNLVNTTFNRYGNVRRALLHHWTPPAEVEPLTSSAFAMLSEITPAESQLRNLFVHDRSRAFHELTHHLDLYVDQLKAAIRLASDLETIASDDDVSAEEQARLNTLQTELLSNAGKALSLTEAAKQLGVTRQALHKRIGLGTALGLMHGSELVVPEAQFVAKGGKPKIVDGLADIVRLFDSSGAGRWSALQFLIELDPNLRKTPLEALKAGDQDAVAHAARAFLNFDEA